MPPYWTRPRTGCRRAAARPSGCAACRPGGRSVAPAAVDRHLGDPESARSRLNARQRVRRDRDDRRRAGQAVGAEAVVQLQLVVRRRGSRPVAVAGHVRVAGGGGGVAPALTRRAGQGAIGLPAQRVPAGTARRASPARPGRPWRSAPTTAAGRMMPCGPMVAPVAEVDGVHTHHPVMEQVGLQHAPAVDAHAVAEPHQVGLGQPVGLAPHAPADPRAERAQPHASTGVPAARWRTTAPRPSRRRCRPPRSARRTRSTAGAPPHGSGRPSSTWRAWPPRPRPPGDAA